MCTYLAIEESCIIYETVQIFFRCFVGNVVDQSFRLWRRVYVLNSG
uniref:Uncharacterized protein n=1 Tax=Arundo donax TaxID=35708 RepID=A0A0A8Z2Q2_ARUDO